MPRKKKEVKLAVIDFETDPFKGGRIPKPFACGFFNGRDYHEFWGPNCADRLVDLLESIEEPHFIFAHNGGKFDFFFLAEWLDNPIKIINGRIVSAKLGIHTMRDSYAIIPESLQRITGGKLEMDYSLFEANVREKHRKDILHYLSVDCEELYKAVKAFTDKFGVNLTIAGTAFKELKKKYAIHPTSRTFDEKYRRFYYGGRCQAFKTGEIKTALKYYDVNSSYPYSMANYLHPLTNKFVVLDNPAQNELDPQGRLVRFGAERPYFIVLDATSRGAFPSRIESGVNKGGLEFISGRGVFNTTSHELQTAIKHRMADIHTIIELHIPYECAKFDEFINPIMADKIACEKSGDRIGRTFNKLLANNGYGKLAQSPDNYFDWHLCRSDVEVIEFFNVKDKKGNYVNAEYDLHEKSGEFSIWKKPVVSDVFNNVATAASITGASRAILLDAIGNSRTPIYCDTDSLICEELAGVSFSDTEIGSWKLEAELDTLYVAGKKLYAGYSGGECVKLASKGVRLTGDQIQKLCRGGSVEWTSQVPSFRFGQDIDDAKFVHREIGKSKKLLKT